MGRTDYITILVLALVGVVGVAAVEVLTLVEAQEWSKFALMVVTFAVILGGPTGLSWPRATEETARGVRIGAK